MDKKEKLKKSEKKNGERSKSDPKDKGNAKSVKVKRTEALDINIKELEDKLSVETPPCGFYYSDEYVINRDQISKDEIEKHPWKKPKIYFNELPLSKKTVKCLSDCIKKFNKMTPIQRAVIPHAIVGRDILGASKTGSGKTLCFLIPMLEKLYRLKWTSMDGLGALIIVPIRELAIQVFEVLKMIGKYHDFSAGLCIGGNDLETEQESIYMMNILVTTPGRLLQHLTETSYFVTDNIQMLIIDEADRILDEGFEETINEILSYLPTNRQTMLFSATLTKSIKRLANMSLKQPEFISLHEVSQNTPANEAEQGKGDKKITPVNLKEYYTVCEPHEKLDILYSFLKTHLTSKVVVFVSSCKQVRFLFEAFKRLKLGMTFFELHGRQKQSKRTAIFYNFSQSTGSVLFATDVVSRGIDFPSIDWVIQLDCPEDVASYIHKAGRTARYKAKGNALLFVSEGERKFIDSLLNIKGMALKKITINPSKMTSLRPILSSILSENHDILYLAQKALTSYVKSIHLNGNKEIFDVTKIDLKELALSYGIVNVPEMKVTAKNSGLEANKEKEGNVIEYEAEGSDEENEIGEKKDDKSDKKKSKLQKLREKIKEKKQKHQEVINKAFNEGKPDSKETKAKVEKKSKNVTLLESSENEEENFLKVKRNPEEVEKLVKELPNNNKKTRKDFIKSDLFTETKAHKEEDEAVLEKKSLYYQKIKGKLEKNLDHDITLHKKRLAEKKIKDKERKKEADYQKHGIGEEESDADAVDDYSEEENTRKDRKHFQDSDSEMEYSEPEVGLKNENPSFKVDIDLKKSSIEDKEKAALQLINKNNSFFKI